MLWQGKSIFLDKLCFNCSVVIICRACEAWIYKIMHECWNNWNFTKGALDYYVATHQKILLSSVYSIYLWNQASLDKHQTGHSTVDPVCSCGGIETVSHYILECPYYEEIREEMLKDMSSIGLRNINLATLLGRSDDEDRETYKRKMEIMSDYIKNSRRFGNTQDLSPQSSTCVFK